LYEFEYLSIFKYSYQALMHNQFDNTILPVGTFNETTMIAG